MTPVLVFISFVFVNYTAPRALKTNIVVGITFVTFEPCHHDC